MTFRTSLLLMALLGAVTAGIRPTAVSADPAFPFQDPNLPLQQRVDDLVGRMTTQEKIGQMLNSASAIDRLGIPAYNWWNEALHGVARAGIATVFPQAIGLGATWDPDLLHTEADAISTEARAKYEDAIQHNNHSGYFGLTFWSPNINIFRDPRWGRGQETYGEDPYLTGQMAVAFVRGMQGNDPKYLKTVSTLKHFAVHSGPEPARHGFDARVDERDLQETYLPAFREGIIEGKADSVMGAYNAINGVPCCADPHLLGDILRGEWGFKGYVVSDCDAVGDIFSGHHFVASPAAASASAVKAGCDLNCGGTYRALGQALKDGLLTEAQLDTAVKRLFTARFRLGMFDPPAMVPYSKIPMSENDSQAHRDLARRAARESIVLLKNDGILPLKKTLKNIAVIGPNADSRDVLLGNYNGTPSHSVTPLEGIRAALGPNVTVTAARGCDLTRANPLLLDEAVTAAKAADAVIMVLGISPRLEGEEMRVTAEGFKGGDRTSLDLPKPQEELLEAIQATGKPVVLTLMNGSALSVNWAAAHVPAIVEAWYPGEEGGSALADVLFGDYNPSGRLPITFYQSVDQLPPFEVYSMAGRTYRYFGGAPLFPFGFGLSYTRFAYSDLTVAPQDHPTNQDVTISAVVQNAGAVAGDEVAELYVTHLNADVPVPFRTLAGIRRVSLQPGEKKTVTFTLTARQLTEIDNTGKRVEKPGTFEISVGGKQPGFQGTADASTTGVVTTRFTVTGPIAPFAP